jgi:hydroxymethylpyrimidine pyrophosphatase-like HAD family hydrolase
MRRARPARISLLLADVDGTLVTHDKVLTERARAAVHSVHNGGIFVEPDLTVIDSHALPPKVSETAVRLVAEHGLDVWVYRGNEWFVRNPDGPHVAREQWTVKFPPTVINDFTGFLDQAVKIVGVSDDHDLVRRCEAAAQERFARLASAARSQPYYLDITHLSANKGGVVDYLSRHLGIAASEIATIEDIPNDLTDVSQEWLRDCHGQWRSGGAGGGGRGDRELR